MFLFRRLIDLEGYVIIQNKIRTDVCIHIKGITVHETHPNVCCTNFWLFSPHTCPKVS